MLTRRGASIGVAALAVVAATAVATSRWPSTDDTFARRIKCEELANAHTKHIAASSSRSAVPYLDRVDFSRARNTCVAQINIYREGHEFEAEVVDLLTKERLFSELCRADKCGDGRDIAIRQAAAAAFVTSMNSVERPVKRR